MKIEIKYFCEICGKEFTDAAECQRHEEKHQETDEKELGKDNME